MTTLLSIYTSPNLEPTRENKKIYKSILQKIKLLKPSSVLEIGSGMGMLGNEIASMGIRYVGVEPDQAQLDLCHSRYPELNVIQGSCYESPQIYALGKFDLVFSTDVIEHLYLPRQLLLFKIAHLTENGSLLVCTPDFGSYWKNILYSITNKWDMVHSPWWDGGHVKFFSKKSLRMLLEEVKFNSFKWSTITNVNIPILPMSVICIASRTKNK
jgi:cyclopropane fatty-acyl-phospholipid synthase-like methyltransferase